MKFLTLAALFELFQSHAARKFFDQSGRAAAGKLRDHLDDGPEPSAAVDAARVVVAASRDAVKSKYWSGEDDLSRRVTSFLGRSSFVDEVVGRLLLSDQPDLDRLKTFYLDDDESSSEEWKSLEEPLDELIEEIETRLDGDPFFGPLRRDLKKLARLDKIVDWQEKLAEIQQEQLAEQRRTAEAAEEIARDVKRLVPVGLDDLTTEERAWLRGLPVECDALPLASDERDVDQVDRARLSRVYVDLATRTAPNFEQLCDRLDVPAKERESLRAQWDEAQDEQRALRSLPSLDQHPLMPWAKGKDALRVALASFEVVETVREHSRMVLLGDPGSGKSTVVNHLAMETAAELLGEREGSLVGEALFPLRIILRKWSAKIAGRSEGLSLFEQAVEDLGSGVPSARWRERLESGKVLILFDGLDEVPTDGDDGIDRREVIVAEIEKAATTYPDCRILVTCRIKPYRDPQWQLVGWPAIEIAPLDRTRRDRFMQRWYDEMVRIGRLQSEKAQTLMKRLQKATQDRRRLREMAEIPLLLTMLARINARTALPEGRVELYKICVHQLLWEWEQMKIEDGDLQGLEDLLATAPREVDKKEIEKVLAQLAFAAHDRCGHDDLALIEKSELRDGLMAMLGDVRGAYDWANDVITLLRRREGLLIEPEPERFSFPHRSFQEYLACMGLLKQKNAGSLARDLCREDVWTEVVELACGYLAAETHDDWLETILRKLIDEPVEEAGDIGRVLVAGRVLGEIGLQRAAASLGAILLETTVSRLRSVMQDGEAAPRQRLEAGLLATGLGDVHDEFDAWVEFPENDLGYAFSAGKYPVTCAEFARFVEDGGESPRLWNGQFWNRSTLPVIGVSWYCATEYCVWLTEKLRAEGVISEEQAVRLPTEAEWMWAALEGRDRPFPWDGDFDESQMNCLGLGRTSPVHLYPQGVSPRSVFDLAGNVWEWLGEPFNETHKTLCGGSWATSKIESLASARNQSVRDFKSSIVGFRIFLVPASRAYSDF